MKQIKDDKGNIYYKDVGYLIDIFRYIEGDAYIVIYEIRKNAEDEITAVDFNFVEKNEFEKTYTWM